MLLAIVIVAKEVLEVRGKNNLGKDQGEMMKDE
jgi:hypothetical protein